MKAAATPPGSFTVFKTILFWDPGWPDAHCGGQGGREFVAILLQLPAEFWGHRHACGVYILTGKLLRTPNPGSPGVPARVALRRAPQFLGRAGQGRAWHISTSLEVRWPAAGCLRGHSHNVAVNRDQAGTCKGKGQGVVSNVSRPRLLPEAMVQTQCKPRG